MFSSYVWNYSTLDQISEEVKKQYPNKIILLGGPHIGDINNRTFYDFICQATKPGEVFLKDVIDSYLNDDYPILDDISWAIGSNKSEVYNLSLSTSVYEDNISHLKKLFSYSQENHLEPFIALETTRGCPYSCVYCEWGGGIGTKVYKKPLEIVKQDIDIITQIGFKSAYLTDANFGIFYERDVEIYRYAHNRGLTLTDVSTFKSKDLEKRIKLIDSWFDIIGTNTHFSKEYNGVSVSLVPNISIQSISDEAMKVAKRSDLGFNDKIKLSQYIQKKCSNHNYPYPNIEMILAMPGSTLDDFYQEMDLLWNFNSRNERYDYMVLPDSEINKKTYQELYSIKTVDVINDMVDEESRVDESPLYKNKKMLFKTVVSCHSFTIEEFKEMWFMNICTEHLLYKIYPMFKSLTIPSKFTKMCYDILVNINDYSEIKNYIDDLFNDLSAPKSIKKINDKFKKNTIDEFLTKNKSILVNELTLKLR
jgi:putative methyltransferase